MNFLATAPGSRRNCRWHLHLRKPWRWGLLVSTKMVKIGKPVMQKYMSWLIRLISWVLFDVGKLITFFFILSAGFWAYHYHCAPWLLGCHNLFWQCWPILLITIPEYVCSSTKNLSLMTIIASVFPSSFLFYGQCWWNMSFSEDVYNLLISFLFHLVVQPTWDSGRVVSLFPFPRNHARQLVRSRRNWPRWIPRLLPNSPWAS